MSIWSSVISFRETHAVGEEEKRLRLIWLLLFPRGKQHIGLGVVATRELC